MYHNTIVLDILQKFGGYFQGSKHTSMWPAGPSLKFGEISAPARCSLFVVAFFGASKGEQRFVFNWSDGSYFCHLFLALVIS